MTSVTTAKSLSYEDWLGMPEVSDQTEEVVDGEIRLMPPARLKHTKTVQRLAKQLDRQLDENTIDVLISQFGLVIRRHPLTCRVPDLAVFIRANVVERDGYIHSAPELAVEVLSPGNTRTEREEKRLDYESLAVPELWVLSPEDRTIEVLQLVDGRLTTISIRASGQLAPKLFPEAVVDIEAIWP